MHHGTCVLIVDDEQELAQLVWAPYLQALGYEIVGVCASAEEALALATVHPPRIAIVDISLAGDMSGVEAAAHLIARFSVQIVFCTAYTRGDAPDLELLTAGFVYLEKPFSMEELGHAVAAAARDAEQKTMESRDHNFLVRMNSKADLISIQINAARRRDGESHD
jgi:DNA-binding response OmpR family regulator